MKSKENGFTLIELIAVIVILGILAATALPKFINLSGDARAAIMKSFEGAMRAANTMLHAKAAAQGELGKQSGSVTVGSMSVSTNYGYAKDGNELKKIMDIPSDIVNVAPNLLNLWTHSKAVRHANCLVSYVPPTSPPDPPKYTIDTDGC